MAHSERDIRTGRLLRKPSRQTELFEKSREEELKARHTRPVECFGVVFENEDARRAHFLDRLKEGLEELQAVLGGPPYTGVDDTVARMATIVHWPMGEEARLCELAERMRHANSSKDLLQRWKDEIGFPHGEIEHILALSDPPWHTACPNLFPAILGIVQFRCSSQIFFRFWEDRALRQSKFTVSLSPKTPQNVEFRQSGPLRTRVMLRNP